MKGCDCMFDTELTLEHTCNIRKPESLISDPVALGMLTQIYRTTYAMKGKEIKDVWVNEETGDIKFTFKE